MNETDTSSGSGMTVGRASPSGTKPSPRASRPRTLLAQLGHYFDDATGAITPPLHLATTFARDRDYRLVGPYSYARERHPSQDILERLLAELEGGGNALVFSSGLAAMHCLLETVPSGRHVLAPRVMYHGGQDWLRRLQSKGRIALTLFDEADPGAAARGVESGRTALVWIETPINPTLTVLDIGTIAEAAHQAGAALAVDGTLAPALTTRALDHGADIVFHSLTKYISGHSDLLGGALIARSDDERWRELRNVRTLTGGIQDPFSCWLTLRGIRTLALRYAAACENAQRFAEHFHGDCRIARVLYPGLPAHPSHEIARKQMKAGFGAMVSVCVAGDAEAAKRVAASTGVFLPATSLGGVESLIEHRRTVEGPNSVVDPTLVRLSIGVEDVNDLIADFDQALSASTNRGSALQRHSHLTSESSTDL